MRRGFTVVELVVVIGLIALLVALVVVSMSGVRASANRAESISALRQMISGYVLYSTDHRQHLMPGYVDEDIIDDGTPPPPDWQNVSLKARLSDGCMLEPGDLSSYVWRLAPYLDHNWQTMYLDYKTKATTTVLEDAYSGNPQVECDGWYGPASTPGVANFNLASMPSFGLNSIFLGGDTRHGGEWANVRCPWRVNPDEDPVTGEAMAATRVSQVKNPALMTVFGPTGRMSDTPFSEDVYYRIGDFQHELGYMVLRPPFVERGFATNVWTGRQWIIGEGGRVEATSHTPVGDPDDIVGLPIVRWGSKEYPIARLDGSADVVDLGEIAIDMRRWSPFETGMEVPGVQPD